MDNKTGTAVFHNSQDITKCILQPCHDTYCIKFLPLVEYRTKFCRPDLLIKLAGLHICTLKDLQLRDNLVTNDSLGRTFYILRETKV